MYLASSSQTATPPGPTSALTVGTGDPKPLIAGADDNGNVGPQTNTGVVQYGDTTVIQLYP